MSRCFRSTSSHHLLPHSSLVVPRNPTRRSHKPTRRACVTSLAVVRVREVEAAAAAEVATVVGPEASTTSSPDHPDDPRKPLHLVVLGHVDAGKSSLMGRLLYEVGVVSARDAHKYQRDAAAAGKVR